MGLEYLRAQQQLASAERSSAKPGPKPLPAFPSSEIQWQRAIGNQALQFPYRVPAFQAKLTISQPGDPYEREADRIADQIMHMPNQEVFSIPHSPTTLQRACGACADGQKPCPKCSLDDELQRKSLVSPMTSLIQRKNEGHKDGFPDVQASINAIRGGGQPLSESARVFFEPRFGHDFSGVRVHTSAAASAVANSLNARAYTHGHNIVFGSGQFAPETDNGKRLLAHELTHVLQQNHASTLPGSVVQRQRSSEGALQRQLQNKVVQLRRLRERARRLRIESDPARRGSAQSARRLQSVDFVPASALGMLGRAIRVQESSGNIRLTASMQISFQGLSEDDGRRRAQTEIPRITQAIRNSWTINMTEGPYLGYTFTLEPRITFRPPLQSRNNNAWQIKVRAQDDSQGSTGTWWDGIIDLNPAHLQGNRVVIVAHEVFHLFGRLDSYLEITDQRGKGSDVVAREDTANRPDLSGLVDPEGLERRLREGRINQTQFSRQTRTTPKIWVEDATTILRALGVEPPTNAVMERAARELDDDVVEGVLSPFQRRRAILEVARQHERLSRIRQRRAAVEANIQWIQTVDRIMQLEAEIEDLQRQLSQTSIP